MTALAPPEPHGRERLASEALRPAAASELWQERLADAGFAAHADAALDSVAVIEAANAEEEALAIAVALREAVDEPGKTAALVTPDRALARRVLAALARWNVPVDDSGGDALADTPAGVFARLAAEAALGRPRAGDAAGAAQASAAAGSTRHRAHRDAGARGAARAAAEAPARAGLAHALQTFRTSLRNSAARSARRCTAPIRATLDRRCRARRRRRLWSRSSRPRWRRWKSLAAARPLSRSRAHRRARIVDDGWPALRRHRPRNWPKRVRRDRRRPARLADRAAATMPSCSTPRSPTARCAGPRPDVRVRIYGPLEARLQPVDRVVLGGLVEGVWPPETRSDPWLSRPMRHELGLDLPERRIGLSAHDFAQALGAPEVILTPRGQARRRADGRLALRAAARRGRGRGALERGARARRALSGAGAQARRSRQAPSPCRGPSRGRRSPRGRRRLSVTEIEHWLRDPYTIYAKHVLKLQPLDASRHAAGRGRPRHRDPRRDRRVHQDVRRQSCPTIRSATLIEIGERAFRAAGGFSRGAGRSGGRAFCASREWFGALRDRAARQARAVRRRDRRQHRNPARRRARSSCTARADRIERLQRRPLRHPRLQDRRAADRASRCAPACRRSSRSKPRSCAQGGFKDIPAGRIGGRARLCAAARRRRGRRGEADRVQGRHARRARRPRAGAADRAGRARSPIRATPYRSLRASDVDARTTATTIISRASRNGR